MSAGASARMRLGPQPGEQIDRGDELRFHWNGQPYPAFRGDTIVSALAAHGLRIFSRSFKYHRPRGILSASAFDPGCAVQVGDEPNVRGAARLLEAGMDVRAQNVWPSLYFDPRSGSQLVSRFLTAGFYYKTFMKPRFLWPLYQRVLREMGTPGGVVSASPTNRTYDKRYAHAEVIVVGGGPAGMSAAVAAAEAGARVLLVEDQPQLGGHLRWGDATDLALLSELRAAVAARPEIEVLVDAVATGRYDDNWLAIMQRGIPGVTERLVKARGAVLVAAPGLIERPYVFEGNDRPGVMLSTAVRKLINCYAVKPGRRAVILSANPEGDSVAADLERAGVEIVATLDARAGELVTRAIGSNEVKRVETNRGQRFDADLLVTAVGWTAPTSLLNMAGNRPIYSQQGARYLLDYDALPRDVMAAGGITGDGTREELLENGRAIGREAARRAHDAVAAPSVVAPLAPPEHPELYRSTTHGFVDFSEDVKSNELFAAVGEGFDSMQLAKRFTTVTMGSAQGKLEVANAVAIHAEATGKSIEQTGTTTWRPPYAPISLGALAGRNFEPTRVSPIQPFHERSGARGLIAGQWIRPDHYGDPAAEVRNVRENVGLIDVTPLGKLDLRGPDVPKLLNLLYVNRWSKLPIGGVRYGVMCAEDGVIMDDGVTGRLDEDHYLMTTTSGGAANIWEWAEEWLQTEYTDWQVHITPVTTSFASINVAGPKSRELMQRVVDGIDLSPDAFPYMTVRRGRVAGVADCFMWRIGFTGELSYELHVPACYGLYVWETLMERGADLGVAPFGIEAQRIMRLEKGHFIVGQDTDGLTQAYGAGLDALVKLGKQDFVGKPELVWQKERGADQRLVALQPVDGSLVPPEASQIVEADSANGRCKIVGRITSSRMSPTLGRSICLGFVHAELAEADTRVTVNLPDGRRVQATVMAHHAHFDPQGERLRG